MGIYCKGGNWFVDYYAPTGRRKREKIGPSRRLAEMVLAKRRIEIAENRYLDIRRENKVLFEKMAEDYLQNYARINKKSWLKDKVILGQFCKFFKGKYLSDITPLAVEDFKRERLDAGKKPATVNRQMACLKHLFTKAIEWEKFKGENPVKKVKFLAVNNRRLRFLEKPQINSLLEVCDDFLKPIVTVALNTGMREGEILNLVWSDVDTGRGIISVRHTKNNEQRYIPMNTVLLDLFKKIQRPDGKSGKRGYVFCGKNGSKIVGRTLLRRFKDAVCKAGITTNAGGFNFHDLRHTFASHLVMSGADIMTVKELLGHKTLAMTLRYSHLSPGFQRSAVELLCNDGSIDWAVATGGPEPQKTATEHMDTFWTPAGEDEKILKKSNDKNHSFIKHFTTTIPAEVKKCQDIPNGQA